MSHGTEKSVTLLPPAVTSKYLNVAITKSEPSGGGIVHLSVSTPGGEFEMILVPNLFSQDFRYKITPEKKMLQWTYQNEAFGVQIKCKSETADLETFMAKLFAENDRS